jgi:hypothetical protein
VLTLTITPATNTLLPAFLIAFYQSTLNNLGQFVATITGTLLNGGQYASQTVDFFPLAAGRYLHFTTVPFVLFGARPFVSPVAASPANSVSLTVTTCPTGATISFIGLTSTHQVYGKVLDRLGSQVRYDDPWA